MARARAERTRSKSAILEDITQGMERLQSFIPQIEDLGRDGFPYLEGARARTELQLKECIKKTFGEKSPEFQTYRQHRLSVDTPADTKQTVALLKNLIAALEDKKLELQGLKPPPPSVEMPPPSPPTTRPQMTLVPPSTTTAQVTITPAAPATPPPITMSVALTTNLDMAQPLTGSQASSSGPASAPVPMSDPISTQPNSSGQPAVPVSSPQSELKGAPSEISPLVTAPVAPPVERIVPPVAEPAQAPARAQAPAPATAPLPEVQLPPPAVTVIQETKTAQPVELMSSLKPQSTVTASSTNDPVDIVKSLCRRFHMVARQLRLRGEYRATLDVEDELDAQDLLHGLLRLHFDDIETTEWLPSYSNGIPRIMFLLNDSRLAVMVKKTRTGLNTKDLTEQLRIDVEHSRTLKRCSTLLCFVYDPEGRIGNPRGLETDLISISDQMTVDVYVAPK